MVLAMTKNTENQPETITKGDDNPGASNSRRKFLTKAGIVAPLAMISVSKPAWGDLTGTTFRCGLSGMVSGNVSVRPDDTNCVGGYSPGYWGNRNGFPRWSGQHDLIFSTTLGGGATKCPGESYDYAGVSMAAIITTTGRGNYRGSFAFHAIAAWLNSQLVPNYVFNTTEVEGIIFDVMTTGFHTTSGGITLNCGQVKTHFDSTY